MNECSWPIAVGAIADSIAAQTPNTAELALISAIFMQLGDALATIVAIRELNDKYKNCQ